MNRISFNGKIVAATEAVLRADNRSYRYGDGFFETMQVYQGKMLLEELHTARLTKTLSLLQLHLPVHLSFEKLKSEIISLCQKNGCEKNARVRLSFSRGQGGLFEGNPTADYCIECWPLDQSIKELNPNGLEIGIYPDARKSMDKFSGIKSASFQSYAMAALYAKEQKWNDALLLNSNGYLADTTIANIFLLSKGKLITPSLDQGCIDGVMRRHIIRVMLEKGQAVEERPVHPDELEQADEIFLSNAIRGIRWVGRIGDKMYVCQQTVDIFNQSVRTILH